MLLFLWKLSLKRRRWKDFSLLFYFPSLFFGSFFAQQHSSNSISYLKRYGCISLFDIQGAEYYWISSFYDNKISFLDGCHRSKEVKINPIFERKLFKKEESEEKKYPKNCTKPFEFYENREKISFSISQCGKFQNLEKYFVKSM